jgi:CelD/BcsL family acetyltransferase involved in cellulose biosynthesis
MRRHRRKLEAEGDLAFEVNDGGDRLDALLDEHFTLEASGWKGENGTAIASTPESRAFYTNLARWAADRGWFRLIFLRLSGKPVACDYALVHNGVLYTLKAGYDESYRSFGPGALLLHDEIAYCFEQGVERIDLLGNEEPFKLSWTDQSVESAALRTFRRNPQGLAAWGFNTAKVRLRQTASRLKNSFHTTQATVALTEVSSFLHVVA